GSGRLRLPPLRVRVPLPGSVTLPELRWSFSALNSPRLHLKPACPLAVMTGDTVRSEVYAKYLDSPNSPRLQRGLMRKAILSLFDNNYLFFIFIKNNFPSWKRNMPPSGATPRRPRSTQRSSTI